MNIIVNIEEPVVLEVGTWMEMMMTTREEVEEDVDDMNGDHMETNGEGAERVTQEGIDCQELLKILSGSDLDKVAVMC